MAADALAEILQHFALPWFLFSLPLLATAGLIGFMLWMHGADQGAT